MTTHAAYAEQLAQEKPMYLGSTLSVITSCCAGLMFGTVAIAQERTGLFIPRAVMIMIVAVLASMGVVLGSQLRSMSEELPSYQSDVPKSVELGAGGAAR